jgi:uncharacterized membrane protein
VSRLQRVLSWLKLRIVAAWRCVRSLDCLLAFLGRIYLVRVPLLTAVDIVGFCAAAFFTDAGLLLGNIFDIGSFYGIFFATWTAFLSAAVVMVTWQVIRLYVNAARRADAIVQRLSHQGSRCEGAAPGSHALCRRSAKPGS